LDFCLIADSSSSWLETTWVVLLVAFGFCFVIFVNELRHFLDAKACGVRCDAFYIGFNPPITIPLLGKLINALVALLGMAGLKLPRVPDPIRLPGSIWKRKWGETTYGIGIIPLGGYVKMFGQDDNPARAAEEMRKARMHKEQQESEGAEQRADSDAYSQSQAGAGTPSDTTGAGKDAAAESSAQGRQGESPEGAEDAEEYYLHPRSYMAKSVPQRLAIISAGVVMNIIFAFIFAAIAYGMGVKYLPCVVSDVIAGSPAWRAGLQSGDEIVQVEDVEYPRFRDLTAKVALSGAEEGVHLLVKRPGREELLRLQLDPEKSGSLYTIGVHIAESLRLSPKPAVAGTPAAAADLQEGDEIVAVNGESVDSFAQYSRLAVQHRNEPLTLTLRRGGEQQGEGNAPGQVTGGQLVEVTVDPNPYRRLGLVMEMGPIAAVKGNSPAARAGLQSGDTIVKVDGEPVGDPVLLPEYARQKAAANETMTLTVKRQGEAQPLELTVQPERNDAYELSITPAPLAVPSLGLAYHIDNRVERVLPGSPAEKAGIATGDLITQAKFVPAPDDESVLAEQLAKRSIEFGEDERNWPGFMSALQRMPPDMEIGLTVKRNDELLEKQLGTYHPVYEEGPVREMFNPERGLNFASLKYVRQAASFGEAMGLGWRETKESLLMVYTFLQRLFQGRVPLTGLGGPIAIAQGAGYHAFEGVSSLLIFLTMLSANLAVVNFLPIPVLDGGHAVFLAYEGIMRRPVSERFFNFLNMLGFLFLLSLMALVITLDIGRTFFDAFLLK